MSSVRRIHRSVGSKNHAMVSILSAMVASCSHAGHSWDGTDRVVRFTTEYQLHCMRSHDLRRN